MAQKRKTTKRFYKCDECHATRLVQRIELIRAAKPKCHRCGCSRLEPVADVTLDELAESRDAKSEMYARLKAQRAQPEGEGW